ncbi:hypothetical protein D3C76_1476770 [compost metagenome]
MPAMNTVRLPLLMSRAKQVFGYGMGTPPAGGVGGEKQVSGNAALDLPSADFEAISLSLA